MTFSTSGSCRNDGDHLHELLSHGLERDGLIAAQHARDAPGVLLWKEALGHDDQQIDVQRDRAEQNQHDQRGRESATSSVRS